MKKRFILATLVALFTTITAQCPWQRELIDLQSSCLCSYNLGHELSVQCDMVDWTILITALQKYAQNIIIDLLYINNSTITTLRSETFVDLKIQNIQLSGCKINKILPDSFRGQEDYLKNLNLQDNDLNEIPIDSLRKLNKLSLLDLSNNRINIVPDGAFETLTKLATLKLSDNNVTLQAHALRGLENCLKNLNLKGTRQKDVPAAVGGMKTLAFLDLSQNSLRELPGRTGLKSFIGLDSLTALNLERNLIQTIEKDAFRGVETTLSSLSLLNNLLPDFPTEALQILTELRVLDIGFNLLTELPNDAFKGNPSITLLALDGNPLATIPYEALSHLNSTLRGLSLGGRFLHCDCRLIWVINWIRNGDLQVTSRERNPQFCGSPPRFRDRGFYSIQPEELNCNKKEDGVGVATVISADLEDISLIEAPAKPIGPSTTTTTTTTKQPTTTTTVVTTTTTSSSTKIAIGTIATTTPSTTTTTTTPTTTASKPPTTTTIKPKVRPVTPAWKTQRPPLIMNGYPSRSSVEESNEVIVKNAFRQDNSVVIQWGSDTANILGFRVVYRLFGDKSFKQGPPLEASEREFRIKNVPSQECIIVCVVSLEEINVTPETVPYQQCREVRTVTTATSNMDKITIAASAAICGTIVIAVIIFVAASRRRTRKLHEFQQQQKLMKNGLPINGLPINCCTGLGPAASPGGPLSSLATLHAFNNNKDWDQVSAYSTHSQRPRIYTTDQPPSLMPDDMRSHFSTKAGKSRSIADGQSQHSFSNHSGRYLNAFPSNLMTSRQDLRQSRQSLALQSERMSTRGGPTSHHIAAAAAAAPPPQLPPQTAHSITSSSRRSRPRSRSRDHNRPGSRYSIAGSTHTLNNYCDNSDNWTDHDMDIYMARNPTTRNGLVPL